MSTSQIMCEGSALGSDVLPFPPFRQRPEPPLGRHVLASTRSPDEICAKVGHEFCDYRLSVLGRDRQLNARFHGIKLRSTALYYLEYGAHVRVDTREYTDFVMVQIPVAGRAAISFGAAEPFVCNPQRAAVFHPQTKMTMKLEPTNQHLLLRLNYSLLRNVLRKKLCRDVKDPIHFDALMDVTETGNHAFLELLRFLTSTLDAVPDLSSLALAEFETLLAGQLLVGQHNNYTDQLHRPARPAVARNISRAADIIEAHADQPLTGDDIAEAIGISTRSLQDGFRRYFDVTPTAYLKNVRLHRVRSELLTADPARITVTSVALRWGFTHLGRFSAVYRDTFGESPSDTLRFKDDAQLQYKSG